MIPFTQYLRPDGEKRHCGFERPSSIETMAKAILNEGYVFECEELRTGEVSITISTDEQDVMSEIVFNGPEVPAAVDRLIERGFKSLV